MSPMAPETMTAPVSQAPPDRATLTIEQWARQGIALLFGDRVIDMHEREILRAFFEEVQLRASNGGVGMGGTPPTEQEAIPESPQEMNANGAEDMYTNEGAEPIEQESY